MYKEKFCSLQKIKDSTHVSGAGGPIEQQPLHGTQRVLDRRPRQASPTATPLRSSKIFQDEVQA